MEFGSGESSRARQKQLLSNMFTNMSDEAVQSPTLFTFRDERKTAAGEVGGMGSVFAFAVMFVQRQLPLTI